ncbi:MAG TPA: ABC transporter permease [Puia sp.]|nr:ABC transporter permease [Puia sp.]
MLKSYFKTAWRNLKKNRVFSLINIAGLSVGISVCYIIMLYVQDELSFDRYNKHADRIARIQFKANLNGGDIREAGVMAPVAATLKRDFPEVEDATRLMFFGGATVTLGPKKFKNDLLAGGDPNYFNIFTLPLIEGDAATALAQSHTVVLSKEVARKYFGAADPVGKAIEINGDSVLFKVTGIFDKVPVNSHFHFDILASMVGFAPALSDSWMMGTFYTYVLLRKGTELAALQAKFPAMVEKYMGPQIQREMGMSLQQFRTKGNELGFTLQPLTAIHLHPTATNELEPAGNSSYVYIFGAIAVFMLLIACINFVNLATAGATKRAKEVGVRKVIGSERSQLVAQFLLESALLVAIAMAISCALIYAALPVFNEIAGKSLAFSLNLQTAGMLLGFGLITGIAAGLYPAFFLSSFKPISVLKGRLSSNNNGFGLRSGLVVFQFVISVSLIIGTIVVYRQMNFIRNKDLGYVKEQVMTIPNSYLLGNNERVFRDMMLRDPQVLNATLSFYKPAGPSNLNNTMMYPKGHDNLTTRMIGYHVDEQYIPTLGMKIVAGRNFSRGMSTDSTGVVLNEAGARALGLTASNEIGADVVIENSDRGTNHPYKVIGVVKDFNFQSLHFAIAPLIMTLEPEGGLIVKVRTGDISGLLGRMKKQWDTFNTGEPFTYSFLDALYDKTYNTEEKTGSIMDIFASLTVLVACLGLFGLVTFTAEQRVKEIGVRKVLGASVSQITRMLSADFLKLVLIACLIAFPISWWGSAKWLQTFAYQTTLGWWIFGLAGCAALLIALITLSFQAVRAATANPVSSLRAD